jgi:hypothetical protein
MGPSVWAGLVSIPIEFQIMSHGPSMSCWDITEPEKGYDFPLFNSIGSSRSQEST